MRCPPHPPAAAAAAVLAVLSVLLRLDMVFSQHPVVKQSGRNNHNDRPGATKKNQPHIVFILIDDQVGPAGAETASHHVRLRQIKGTAVMCLKKYHSKLVGSRSHAPCLTQVGKVTK